ncbi:chemotaxis protein [Vibrio gangliei]|uniref:chemotaxis protein n=1 Tax=Vibrio gangliei TaxID=2077090 RepID=UPI000D019440|nr:chemotaxis protein [Vibrio gangliei]
MKIQGLILDETDIIQSTKLNRSTGESEQVATINLVTTFPTDTIRVSISADLWNKGEAGKVLKSLVGSRTEFQIKYNEMSFADDKGQHRSFNGFQLFALPTPNQAKG